MTDEVSALRRQVSTLERRVFVLSLCLAVLAIYLLLFGTEFRAKAASQPQSLTVRRLAVVDGKGTELVVISAPLPEPIIQGRRVKRDGPVSGILIYDPKGNERGGYVTSDTADLGAFITLDSERDQVFTAYANAATGATVWVSNNKHDAVAFTTHMQPELEIVQNRKVIFKQPPTAPDFH